MKVYIVTSGDYSDYSIEKVFISPKKAWEYASLDERRIVEVYDVCENLASKKPRTSIIVKYNFEKDDLYSVDISKHTVFSPGIDNDSYFPCVFAFSLPNTERMYYKATNLRTQSKTILKIARDKFAEYLAAQEKSREQLIEESKEECNKKREKFNRTYGTFYSTSIDTKTIISAEVGEILRQKVICGEALPGEKELGTIFKTVREKHEKVHEEE